MLEIQIRDGHHVVDMDYVDKNKNKDNEARDRFKALFAQERPHLDWSKIEEQIQQSKDEFSKIAHELQVADSKGCLMVRINLYVYGDVLFKDVQGDDEPDYIYANASVYIINKDYNIVVNEEGSQLELIDSSSGLLKSIHISHDMELIRHIENILEFYVKNK